MIEDLARDYSEYLRVDLKNEFKDIQDTIDDMLTRLDEFENLVNMVTTDSKLCADISIPIVLHSQQTLDSLCNQVDALEKLIGRVKSDMDIIETQVYEAEAELVQSSGKLKNIFKPLFFKKSPNDTSVKRNSKTLTSYEAPVLFTTSSFFPSQNEDAVKEQPNSS